MKRTNPTPVTVGAGCLLIILAVLGVLAATGLIIFLGWNLGVVALVAACGGHVAKIGFFTALFVGVAINVIRGIFNASKVTT